MLGNPLGNILLAGILGATAMAAFLYALHFGRIANGDFVRAIGSIGSKTEYNSIPIGLAIHYVTGILFAFLYALLVGMVPDEAYVTALVLCGFFGFCHGLVVAVALIYLVGIEHPLRRFQKIGAGVAVAYCVAHIVYGVVVGAILGSAADYSAYRPRFGAEIQKLDLNRAHATDDKRSHEFWC